MWTKNAWRHYTLCIWYLYSRLPALSLTLVALQGTLFSSSWGDFKNLLSVRIHIRMKLNLSPSSCQRDSSELHHAFSKAHLQRCEIRWQGYLKALCSKPLELLHVLVAHWVHYKQLWEFFVTYTQEPTRSEDINIKGQAFPRLFCNCGE